LDVTNFKHNFEFQKVNLSMIAPLDNVV